MTDLIDFSSRHNQYIQNPDGSFSRMDEPYFKSEQIADNTWKILSSGDYSYLVAGERDAIAVDTGYGAGNIRTYMQSLTDRPLCCVINTHDHFDHTANNGYFEKAFMTAETARLASIPFPSFAGIRFPVDYEKEIIKEGYRFDLGGRDLIVFSIPDHAAGSIALLDRKARLLFTGDEFMPEGKKINGELSRFRENVEKLWKYREEFDLLCAGSGVFSGELLNRYRECLDYIASGQEGEIPNEDIVLPPVIPAPDGSQAYHRQFPHPEDIPKETDSAERMYLRCVEHAGICITYDIRKNR